MRDTYLLNSMISVENLLRVSLFDPGSGDLLKNFDVSIKSKEVLNQVLDFIDSLTDLTLEKLTAEDGYECPLSVVRPLFDLIKETKNLDGLYVTLASSFRTQDLTIWEASTELTSRMANDLKAIIYEDYKLYMTTCNLLFRFDKITDFFYIKLNTSLTDILVTVLDPYQPTYVELQFTTVLKPGTHFDFSGVQKIISIDTTRTIPFSLHNVTLLRQERKLDGGPVTFVFQGLLEQPLIG